MKHAIIVISVVTALSVNACRNEKKKDTWQEQRQTEIHNFDSSRSTVGDLEKILNDTSDKGSIRVKFPTGEWNFYCNGCAKLPTKEIWATIEFTVDDISEKSIGDWIEKNKIKGVHIQIDSSQPAEKFFVLEKILRGRGIIYWVGLEGSLGRDMIRLRETDGNERAAATDSKAEQAVPVQTPPDYTPK